MKVGGKAVALALLLAAASASAQPQVASGAFDTLIAQAKGLMAGEPEKALPIAAKAGTAADALPAGRPRLIAHAEADWLRGEAMTRINKPDQARPIIAAALATARTLAPRSKLEADLMMSAAAIDWTTGRVREALISFQNAYHVYGVLGDQRGQAKALQYIGTIYFDARDYPRMLRYYRQAEEAYRGDPSLTISSLNNQGDALKEMHRFSEAIKLYDRALRAARGMDSPTLEVRILTNMASAQFLAGRLAAADAAADRGLRRAAVEETGWEPFLWGVKAQVAFARGDRALARSFVEKTFAGRDLDQTTVQYREFHETAYKLYRLLGNDKLALRHLAAFKRLDDEARDVTASTNSALLSARFDFTNQELSIANLKAGQLQRDVALERSRARLHRLTFYGLVAALVVALAVVAGTLFALFSIRRSRNEVRATNATLSVTNVALEKALKARTDFLAMTSHEIRTPLNGILGMTQVLLADRTVDAPVRSKVEVVHGAGETMRALVDDLLDVAKMEAGEASAIEEEVQPAAVVRQAVRLWSGQAEAKQLALDLAIATDLPKSIVSDGGRLRQILSNLISNAVKFTPAGSVRIEAGTEVHEGGEQLVMRVVDTGIGIPEDRLEDIFEPFKQVDSGTSRQFGGTGLGLAICRNLAALLGGTVSVTSAVGAGSTFVLRLPLRRLATAASAERVPARSLAEARLLLVDPNLLTQSMLRAVLTPAVASIKACDEVSMIPDALVANAADLIVVEASALDGPALDQAAKIALEAGARLVVMFKPDTSLNADMIVRAGGLPIAKPLAAPTLLRLLADYMHDASQEVRAAA